MPDPAGEPLSHRRISPKELAARGWTAVPQFCDGHKFPQYKHASGWTIAHCGHPTALWPYMLTDPDGRTFLTGAAVSGRRDFGTAWPTVASAVDYVNSNHKEEGTK